MAGVMHSTFQLRQIWKGLGILSFAGLFFPGLAFILFGVAAPQDSLVGALWGWGILLCACALPSFAQRPTLFLFGLLAPFYCWYIFRFNHALPSQVVAMASSASASEVAEFLVMEWRGLLLAAGCGVLMAIGHRIPCQFDKRRMAVIGLGLVSVLVSQRTFSTYFSSSQRPLLSNSLVSQSYPTAFLGALLHERYEDDFVAQSIKPGQVSAANEVDLAILVIGESARADHWSLNGYEKPTTPNIGRENVINFPAVRSIGNCSAVSVPAMLTMQGVEDRPLLTGPVIRQPSIVEIFRAAGYFTALVTNQETSSFARTGSNFDVARSIYVNGAFGNAYDTDLLPEIEIVIAAPMKRKFLIVHLRGSHFNYRDRYRDQFDVFTHGVIGEYDNSILATDAFLATLIARLKATGLRVALAYSSDHGDDFDKNESRLKLHCQIPSNNDTVVPAFFWLQGEFPSEKVGNLRKNARHHVSQAGIVPALLDLSGIQMNSPLMARTLTLPQTESLEQLTIDPLGVVYRCTLAQGCWKDEPVGRSSKVHE
ncbi:MAG: phosphoethanolamine transferase [Sideroxyarcus sp.]|nr:phosphoethanolamine transferase [Sideroxyarcus sp.]